MAQFFFFFEYCLWLAPLYYLTWSRETFDKTLEFAEYAKTPPFSGHLRPRGSSIYEYIPKKAKFCLWYVFQNAYSSAVLQAIKIKFYTVIVKWWSFYLVDRSLRRLYQIRKSWLCVQVCAMKNRRQHSVFLFVNDRSKPLACHALTSKQDIMV